ncbi:DNA cytosine methyltransferase [Enterococcus faecalis]|jgi:DNA (cytosine-5)-methyltransferase 1|uniref:DNA cytosine methyltransferase n=1 Tax=Enterococcus faecalis TaxID=1351 RepID=UPI000CF13964|nr:DNA cytosine methyltransferase [Enterococcus faecalis]EGO5081323.1 DNA cytosine methyltransferase [Enterococcus faecalis]EGO6125600.1 DNA cytosine methyltransferase [Enterococcus faecalis]EGO7589771.1 DNA cytosine methyltransferase [Enterococcus faecalis]EGO7950809.1 DNA cytosine methyltransferase [Enterococcus faecalis]EGO8662896.1 DNA cytosine methyltransferase [Enterococcus faecalis]
MKPKVIDLFAGVGGMSLGFEQCGYEIVLANEYDKSIANAYKANHKNTKMIVGDIVELDLEAVFSPFIGKIDVIIGGPPCQGFSQKGQRKSINDDRNFLFKYFVSVVNLVKPKYFVMENVPNLLTAENGYFKKEIYDLFGSLGYTLNSGVLNAADYGVPQNRKRAIIIGKLGDELVKLPKPNFEKITIWQAISDLSYLESGEGIDESDYQMAPNSEYQRQLRKNSNTLKNHKATNHSKLALERLKLIPQNGGRDSLPEKHLTKSIYSGTWTRMKKNEQSVTITTRFDTPSSGKFTHPFLNRAITVREAARIQSFPDNFIFVGTKTSQMKQVGNAVPPKLANTLAKTILNDMRGLTDD